jgi:flagellar basal-body rod modification protein FlgD
MQGIGGFNANGANAIGGDSPAQAADPIQTPGGSAGLLSSDKDAKRASTEAQEGELWKQIQARYGAKAEKPREIKKTLGKDDFLRIMVTQMRNQDPTSPFKAEEMASQMAQFASIEQLQNLNTTVGKMASNNQPIERMAMTNMIGKTVTIDRERFAHNENETSPLGFSLMRDAESVQVKIMSESGETVLEQDLGKMAAGDQTFVWDGVRSNGMPTQSGNFIYRVEATDAGGRPIAMNSRAQSKVFGVSFEGQEGVLLVGNPNAPQKIAMRNVIRIDSSAENSPAQAVNQPVIPGARSMSSALQSQGVGAIAPRSEPAPQGMSVGLAAKAYEAAKASDGKNFSNEKSENSAEKGFPNGISSYENN